MRADTSMEKLASRRPAFRAGGTVTAGNASQLNDGSAALVLASEEAAHSLGRDSLARIVSSATSGVEPHLYGIGPVEAVRAVLRRGGVGMRDLVGLELNEAFAGLPARMAGARSTSTAVPSPSAIPWGARGPVFLTTLVHELRRRGGGYGVAAMCIGVGQGIAVLVEA